MNCHLDIKIATQNKYWLDLFCIFCSLHPITNAWISLYVGHIPFPSFLHIFQLKYETGMHQVRILIESYNVLPAVGSHQILTFSSRNLLILYLTERKNTTLVFLPEMNSISVCDVCGSSDCPHCGPTVSDLQLTISGSSYPTVFPISLTLLLAIVIMMLL